MPEADRLAERVAEAALLTGDFVLSSGKRSDVYVDKYLFSTDPELLADLASGLLSLVPEDVDRLAGVELGAVPLTVAAALASGKPYLIARKGVKDYGTSKNVEGEFDAGDRIALLEDIVTTGAQSVAAAKRLREAGLRVVGIFAVLDRREGRDGVSPQDELEGFPFRSLLRMQDLRVVKGI